MSTQSPVKENTQWPALAQDALAKTLSITLDKGLTGSEAKQRLAHTGPNRLPKGETIPLWMLALHQVKDPLIYILVVAGTLSLVMGELADGSFIFGIILLNAALGTYQEGKAQRSAQKLQQLTSPEVRVKRDGHWQTMAAEELVPGDLIRLESGSRVAADVRLTAVDELTCNEALLTGESEPVHKQIEPIEDGPLSLADMRNMAFAGTTIVQGSGQGIVVATGLDTEIGHIAKHTTSGKAGKTPLVTRMEKFTRRLSWVVLALSAGLFGLSVWQGTPVQEAFFVIVALAVAAIPEGLPVAMTVALAIASERMARRQVIVQKLPAVEGLGSCTLIATDKTGTLTQNRQQLQALAVAGSEPLVWDTDADQAQEQARLANSVLERLYRCGLRCNEAEEASETAHDQNPGDHIETTHFVGDPIDVALMHEGLAYFSQHPNPGALVLSIPYSSARRYAARAYAEEDQTRAYIKGSLSKLLPLCSHMQAANGETQPIDPNEIAQLENALTCQGFRVLAMADKHAVEDPEALRNHLENDEPAELTLLGLVGFRDPVRPGVDRAIAFCRNANIQVAMITGDDPRTAQAVAQQLGILSAQEAGQDTMIATGQQLENHPDLAAVRVFARVSPTQKLDIVNQLKGAGHFVAVTGDGINDAPALRQANIGVAMGSGTDVAKDVASIIVSDDNFSTIVEGIKEGRFAYNNIRKVIFFLIATAIAELVLLIGSIVGDLPLPLTAVQLLWLNVITSGIQDMALPFEAGDPSEIDHPPRDPKEPLFNRQMLEQTALAGLVMGLLSFGLWLWLLGPAHMEAPAARNMVLLLLVLLENFHIFNCRSETRSIFRIPLSANWILVLGVLGAQGLHIASMYIPFTERLLGVAPVTLWQWVQLCLLASTVLMAIELYKLLVSRPRAKAGKP